MVKPIRSGPCPANNRIMFVGKGVGNEELEQNLPLVGYAGILFTRFLNDCGLERNDSFITNVAHEPYKQAFLKKTDAKKQGLDSPISGRYPCKQIRDGLPLLPKMVQASEPNVIVALGEEALWALTGETGINRWRGSIIETEYAGRELKIIPTFNPAAVLRSYDLHPIFKWDLLRVAKEAKSPRAEKHPFEKEIWPSYERVMEYLENEVRGNTVACDIEAKFNQPTIFGLATSKHHALTIPFFTDENPLGHWDSEQETNIILKLREVLTDSSTHAIWQNAMFDCQFLPAVWGFIPNHTDDTMVMNHVCYPGLPSTIQPNALHSLASFYCKFYRFWKEDSKDQEADSKKEKLRFPNEADLVYNADDVLYTYEVWEGLCRELSSWKLWPQYNFLMRLFGPVLRMALRGVKIDQDYKNWLKGHCLQEMSSRSEWFEKVLGHPLNPSSDVQVKKLFFDDLKMPAVRDPSTKNLTTSDQALDKFKKNQPLLKPLCEKIQEYRSFKVFRQTFAEAPLSDDGRLRTTIKITGTKTFRFSSKKDAFGRGANLQTISKGTEED